jgi:hypothetical protein
MTRRAITPLQSCRSKYLLSLKQIILEINQKLMSKYTIALFLNDKIIVGNRLST